MMNKELPKQIVRAIKEYRALVDIREKRVDALWSSLPPNLLYPTTVRMAEEVRGKDLFAIFYWKWPNGQGGVELMLQQPRKGAGKVPPQILWDIEFYGKSRAGEHWDGWQMAPHSLYSELTDEEQQESNAEWEFFSQIIQKFQGKNEMPIWGKRGAALDLVLKEEQRIAERTLWMTKLGAEVLTGLLGNEATLKIYEDSETEVGEIRPFRFRWDEEGGGHTFIHVDGRSVDDDYNITVTSSTPKGIHIIANIGKTSKTKAKRVFRQIGKTVLDLRQNK